MTAQNERRERVARWLSWQFDDSIAFATDGAILIDDAWRRKADELLSLLDGLQ